MKAYIYLIYGTNNNRNMPHCTISLHQGWIQDNSVGYYKNCGMRTKTHNWEVEKEKETHDKEKFLNYVNSNYKYLKRHLQSWAYNTHRTFDDDIFQDTIIKIYNLIEKKGKVNDSSDRGFECYFFMAYKQNLAREQEYARNKLRDDNSNLSEQHEQFKSQQMTPEEKVLSDARKDFTIRYLLNKVEENFDMVTFRLFRIKLFYGCTYKKLVEMTKIRDSKQRVSKVNKWLKDNVTKQEVNKAFEDYINNL